MLNILYIIIIFLPISLFSCDKQYDDIVEAVNTIVEIKINGYKNTGNRGLSKKCCGIQQNKKCLPCKMMFVLIKKRSYYSEGKYLNIATFSKESEEIYEKYYENLLLASSVYNYLQIVMLNTNDKKTKHEEYPLIDTSMLTKYAYESAYGINNILEIWAEIILKSISPIIRNYYSMIRIDSLYIKQYKHSDGSCCTGVEAEDCPDECGYYLTWTYSKNDSIISEAQSPNTKSRKQNISLTLASNDPQLIEEKIFYTVGVYSGLLYEMDHINTPILYDLPNVENRLINSVGVFGNIIFNISWMHNCQIQGGINCHKRCNADLGTEFCDMERGHSRCLNGATDTNTCINIAKTCVDKTCSGNGNCLLINDIPTCNCNPGYGGNYCQDWQCDSGCNGNGLCIGSNLCSCYVPNTGKECEQYPCHEDRAKKCGQYGYCKIFAGNEHCDCFNKYIKGENCTEAICSQECVFGKCIYNSRRDITNCVCDELYDGASCNVLRKKFNSKINNISLYLPIAILVIVIIILAVLSGLIYKGIIKIKFSTMNVLYESSDTLKFEMEL